MYNIEACRITFLLTSQLSFEKSCVLSRHILVWTGVLVFVEKNLWRGDHFPSRALDGAVTRSVDLPRIWPTLKECSFCEDMKYCCCSKYPHVKVGMFISFKTCDSQKDDISCCFDQSNLKEKNELRQCFLMTEFRKGLATCLMTHVGLLEQDCKNDVVSPLSL